LVFVVLDGVVAFSCQDEISRDELGALVKQLVERMLSVGCGFTKEDWASRVFDVVTTSSNCLSVRLHGELLEISREAVEILIEGRHEMGLSTKKVGIPDAQKTADHGNILLKRGLLEMLVHRVCTSQELVEVVIANVQADAEADGAPHTVTSTNPIRKTEHVLLVNAEFGHFRLVGGESNKVLGDVSIFFRSLEEPLLGGIGIGGGLGGCKGLGCDEEQCGLGIRVLQRFGNVGSINVGNKVELEVAISVWLQCFRDHDRAARAR
jgi:hypothetical protein